MKKAMAARAGRAGKLIEKRNALYSKKALVEGQREYVSECISHAWRAYGELFRKRLKIDRNDLEQEAMVKSIELARRFDPKRGTRFKSILRTRIDGFITDKLREAYRTRRNGVEVNVDTEVFNLFPDRGAGKRFGREDKAALLRAVKKTEFSKTPKISRRNRRIIINYYGLDRKPPQNEKTLGEQHGLTETRISQIIRNGLTTLSKEKAFKSLWEQ